MKRTFRCSLTVRQCASSDLSGITIIAWVVHRTQIRAVMATGLFVRVQRLIIGEAVEDDLANEIFSKFCMGK